MIRRLLIALLFCLSATSAHAQQTITTTTIASLGGTVNCIGLVASVTRLQQPDGTLQTWLSASVRDCQDGTAPPTHFLASVNSKIPDSDFTVDRTGARLSTATPYGPFTATWTLTRDAHSAYNASWITDTRNQPTSKQIQNDDTTSATVIGMFGSWIADRPGQLTVSTVKK